MSELIKITVTEVVLGREGDVKFIYHIECDEHNHYAIVEAYDCFFAMRREGGRVGVSICSEDGVAFRTLWTEDTPEEIEFTLRTLIEQWDEDAYDDWLESCDYAAAERMVGSIEPIDGVDGSGPADRIGIPD